MHVLASHVLLGLKCLLHTGRHAEPVVIALLSIPYYIHLVAVSISKKSAVFDILSFLLVNVNLKLYQNSKKKFTKNDTLKVYRESLKDSSK